jgi:hypothetical protein
MDCTVRFCFHFQSRLAPDSEEDRRDQWPRPHLTEDASFNLNFNLGSQALEQALKSKEEAHEKEHRQNTKNTQLSRSLGETETAGGEKPYP